jgi:hypothetical protein
MPCTEEVTHVCTDRSCTTGAEAAQVLLQMLGCFWGLLFRCCEAPGRVFEWPCGKPVTATNAHKNPLPTVCVKTTVSGGA